MKKLLLLLLLLPLFIACEKEVQEPTQFRLSPDAKIRIEAVKSGTQRVVSDSTDVDSTEIDTIHLSALEVVKQAHSLSYYNDSTMSSSYWQAGFAGKDTISENPALLRWGEEIITLDGFGVPILVKSFIYAYDMVVERKIGDSRLDTIAYIPNQQMRNAELNIKIALENKDTLAVYDIFNNAFKFIPITGIEYKELKEQGLQ